MTVDWLRGTIYITMFDCDWYISILIVRARSCSFPLVSLSLHWTDENSCSLSLDAVTLRRKERMELSKRPHKDCSPSICKCLACRYKLKTRLNKKCVINCKADCIDCKKRLSNVTQGYGRGAWGQNSVFWYSIIKLTFQDKYPKKSPN